jgi:DNA-binding CsgD family transcriptional regulator
MSTNNYKKQAASSNASSISSQGISVGKNVSPGSVDGDQLLLRLGTVAQELYGQSTGVAERLCQEIADATQGQVQLVLQRYQYQPVQSASTIEDLWVSAQVEYAGRLYGKLAIAPHPTLPDQTVLPYQYIRLLASNCALILFSLETSAYFRRECSSPVKLTEDLTQREQEILELLCRGLARKRIAVLLKIERGTVAKLCGTLFKKLGVATEREAIAAAFMLGLSSPIENLAAYVSLRSVKQET